MEEYAIKVDHIKKLYKLYDKPLDRVKESLGFAKKKKYKEFYALKDLSFRVKKGECVGIIGTNGSGKSTILKIITGVLNPTEGDVAIDGRISALLELGAGFNPEYTGIENIYLNGTTIGFTKEEIEARIQDIIDFADIGDFINQPVKTYSSGMFVRLAFAVAINIDPEILIVDEALSVGDVFFQAKCYHKFEEFKSMGKTILFVSHDLGSICKYCDRAILLNKGVLIEEGNPKDIVDIYKKILVNQYHPQEDNAEPETARTTVQGSDWKSSMLLNPEHEEYGSHQAEIIDFGIFDKDGKLSNTIQKLEDFEIRLKVEFHESISDPIFAFIIKDLKGSELCGTNTFIEKQDIGTVTAGEILEISFHQKMMLQNGQYLLQLGCTGYAGDDLVVYHRLYGVCCIQVISDKITTGYFDVNTEVKIIRG